MWHRRWGYTRSVRTSELPSGLGLNEVLRRGDGRLDDICVSPETYPLQWWLREWDIPIEIDNDGFKAVVAELRSRHSMDQPSLWDEPFDPCDEGYRAFRDQVVRSQALHLVPQYDAMRRIVDLFLDHDVPTDDIWVAPSGQKGFVLVVSRTLMHEPWEYGTDCPGTRTKDFLRSLLGDLYSFIDETIYGDYPRILRCFEVPHGKTGLYRRRFDVDRFLRGPLQDLLTECLVPRYTEIAEWNEDRDYIPRTLSPQLVASLFPRLDSAPAEYLAEGLAERWDDFLRTWIPEARKKPRKKPGSRRTRHSKKQRQRAQRSRQGIDKAIKERPCLKSIEDGWLEDGYSSGLTRNQVAPSVATVLMDSGVEEGEASTAIEDWLDGGQLETQEPEKIETETRNLVRSVFNSWVLKPCTCQMMVNAGCDCDPRCPAYRTMRMES